VHSEACRDCNKRRLAIDVERHTDDNGKDLTALVQISSDTQHLVLDMLKLQDVSSLKALLLDPDVLVVMHSAHNDLHGLWWEFGVRVKTFLDTRELALMLGYERLGLAALVQSLFGVTINKTYQIADCPEGRCRLTC